MNDLSQHKGTAKNNSFFVRARNHRTENHSVCAIHKDSSTGLTQLSRKQFIFRGAHNYFLIASLLCFILCIFISSAAKASYFGWHYKPVQQRSFAKNISTKHTLSGDLPTFKHHLSKAPTLSKNTLNSGVSFTLPLPNNRWQDISVIETPVLSKALQQQFPDLKTYRFWGKNNAAIYGNISTSTNNMHAIIHSPDGQVIINSLPGSYGTQYTSEYKPTQSAQSFSCTTYAPIDRHHRLTKQTHNNVHNTANRSSAKIGQPYVLRLAIAATQGFIATAGQGNANRAYQHIVQGINTINAITARDLGITFEGRTGEKSSIIMSARRSYLQFLFQALGLPFLPTYNDFQVKWSSQIDSKNRITVLGLGAIDPIILLRALLLTDCKAIILSQPVIFPLS